MEWSVNTTISLLVGLGVGPILLEFGKRFLDWLSGRGKDRRNEVDRAWQRADREARNRRIVEEHAARLRRQLIEAPCVRADEIDPYPTYPKESA